MSEELKPCPFCGGTRIFISEDPLTLHEYAYCDECKASGPEMEDEYTATKAWNRRTNE